MIVKIVLAGIEYLNIMSFIDYKSVFSELI